MIGGTWNIRGTGKTGRKQALSDWISKYKIEFLTVQETKKEKMSLAFLKSISGAWDFDWFELPANNTAGGVLVGFRNDLFDILSVHKFKFCMSVAVRNKFDGFSWCFVAVYGTTYYDQKMEFIAELHDVLSGCSIPTLVGGTLIWLDRMQIKAMAKLMLIGLCCSMIGSIDGL
jgi:exonuclease III